VKGTTGKLKGVVLKENKEQKVEIWNGYKVYTVEACHVDQIVCEHSKKMKKKKQELLSCPQNLLLLQPNFLLAKEDGS
jgi:hypothetical protein